jgi:hypothetical protein
MTTPERGGGPAPGADDQLDITISDKGGIEDV